MMRNTLEQALLDDLMNSHRLCLGGTNRDSRPQNKKGQLIAGLPLLRSDSPNPPGCFDQLAYGI
jgi:hypothetical protein